MNVMRLNFSHGTHNYHEQTIKNLRECLKSTDEKTIAILLDTKGPEIRTGKLEGGAEIRLEVGQSFNFYVGKERIGSFEGVWVTYDFLPMTVAPGDDILVDDGLLSFRVVNCTEDHVETIVQNNGVLGETKGMNLPGLVVNLPALTEKDQLDILFGIEQDVDFIAASFIRKASDVLAIRELLGDSGIQIISKIENQEGIANFDEILAVSDGIMVARGDLGVEIPVEQVARYQKLMIKKCNIAGKPCITATQMLESMVVNPRPTRAEATDVANAVLDGSDAVMLSGETAKGAHPIKAAEMMVKICREAEADIQYAELYAAMRKNIQIPISVDEAIAACAVKSAWDVHAACIIVLTQSGNMARVLSKYRPIPPVLAVCASAQAACQLQVLRGVYPFTVATMVGTPGIVREAMHTAIRRGMANVGDPIVITSGHIENYSGSTNMMRVLPCIDSSSSTN